MIDESSLSEKAVKAPKAKAKAKSKQHIEDGSGSSKTETKEGINLEYLIDKLCKDAVELKNDLTGAKNTAEYIEIEVTHTPSLSELKESQKLAELAALKAEADSIFDTRLRRAIRLSTNWQGIKKLCGEAVDEKHQFRTVLDALLNDGTPKVVDFQKAVGDLKKRVQFELQLAAGEQA